MGFSAGAVTAALYMLEKQRRGEKLPFRGAIFLSSAANTAEKAFLDVRPEVDVLRIPTAHVWGEADENAPTGGQDLASICDPTLRRVLVHDGGHEMPRKEYLMETVHTIRRTLLEAGYH
jgi:predicted esterase